MGHNSVNNSLYNGSINALQFPPTTQRYLAEVEILTPNFERKDCNCCCTMDEMLSSIETQQQFDSRPQIFVRPLPHHQIFTNNNNKCQSNNNALSITAL